MDKPLLKRRAPAVPLVRLGGPFEPLVAPRLGARFPAYEAKERDLVLDPVAHRDPAPGSGNP